MNPWIQILFIALAVTLAGGIALWCLIDHERGTTWAISVVRDRFPDLDHLSASAVRAWLDDCGRPAPVVVDARSDEEFALSHLAGAIHLDLESTRDEALAALDPDRDYVVYCSAGYRSSQLARRMKAAGLTRVANLEGGIFAWANAGYPVVQGPSPEEVVHPYHPLFARLLKPERRPRSRPDRP